MSKIVTGFIIWSLWFSVCHSEEVQCSRFHYEEQILAKVIRLEHKLELLEARYNSEGSSEKSLCPDAWTRFQSSCYLFPNGDVNFSTATHICSKHGANIVQIEDYSENNFLTNHMKDLKDSNYWTGLVRNETTGNWSWYNTGINAKFTDWSSHSPNNYGGNQQCAFMQSAYNFEWNDMDCDVKYRAVCEKKI